MKSKLTPEILEAAKNPPGDALIGDFVVSSRILQRAVDTAEKLLHARLDTNPSLEAGCGVQITRKITKGSYSVPDPIKFLAAVRTLLPEDDSIARTFTPSMTRIKDEIAEKMSVPKSGRAPVTSESVFDGHLRPLVEQGERRILQFQ